MAQDLAGAILTRRFESEGYRVSPATRRRPTASPSLVGTAPVTELELVVLPGPDELADPSEVDLASLDAFFDLTTELDLAEILHQLDVVGADAAGIEPDYRASRRLTNIDPVDAHERVDRRSDMFGCHIIYT